MSKIVQIVYTKQGQLDLEHVNLACNYLNKGGVIAVPTDTIYGLTARVDNSTALNRIYKIKGRDQRKPLAVCLSSLNDLDRVADAQKLHPRILQSLLPGSITILLKRSKHLNESLNPGIDTIGIRIPDHNFIRSLCHLCGPLALTSANRSGKTSPLVVQDFEDLWDELDGVFDAGVLRNILKNDDDDSDQINQRLGSTVVDLSKPNRYTIIREGCSLNRTINILQRFGFRQESKTGG